MIIGLSSGNFYRLLPKKHHNSLPHNLSFWKKDYGNAIEIHCSNEKNVDYLLDKDVNFSFFQYVSVHAPKISYQKEKQTKKILEKFKLMKNKYNIQNFVFHVEKNVNWSLFDNFKDIPISLENMDKDKDVGKSLEEVEKIISKHNFTLTLDLQHCYTNDKSMQLAVDFHNKFKSIIISYHISGFCDKIKHYPLFKTRQNEIMDAIKIKNIPIIIESTFDHINDAEQEISYIKNILK